MNWPMKLESGEQKPIKTSKFYGKNVFSPEKEENPMESGSSRYEYLQKTVETVYTPPPQNE